MTDTSTAALAAIEVTGRAKNLRAQALWLIRGGSLTADEVAALLDESVLAIRPRITELNQAKAIIDTGERRRNHSGRNAIVWAAQV